MQDEQWFVVHNGREIPCKSDREAYNLAYQKCAYTPGLNMHIEPLEKKIYTWKAEATH